MHIDHSISQEAANHKLRVLINTGDENKMIIIYGTYLCYNNITSSVARRGGARAKQHRMLAGHPGNTKHEGVVSSNYITQVPLFSTMV
jgi:hypothetical protein